MDRFIRILVRRIDVEGHGGVDVHTKALFYLPDDLLPQLTTVEWGSAVVGDEFQQARAVLLHLLRFVEVDIVEIEISVQASICFERSQSILLDRLQMQSLLGRQPETHFCLHPMQQHFDPFFFHLLEIRGPMIPPDF